MKTIRRKLAAEKCRIQRRLELARHRVTKKPALDAACVRYELADKVRGIVLRKDLEIARHGEALFDDIRYFFYITNAESLTAADVVREANARCNQENLIAQLKGGLRALAAHVNTLVATWAYMVMTSLAWTLKAWAALMLPVQTRWQERHKEERDCVLRMEFRTFVQAFIMISAQIITAGRRITYRLLAWNPWQHVFFRLLDAFQT